MPFLEKIRRNNAPDWHGCKTIRVKVENVIACLKRFKIVSDKYRNRRKRFGLRFSLISALYNKGLTS